MRLATKAVPCGVRDLGAVETDVPQCAIIKSRKLLDGAPVLSPGGEAPDESGDVHITFLYVLTAGNGLSE
jgi:hypothetical protein